MATKVRRLTAVTAVPDLLVVRAPVVPVAMAPVVLVRAARVVTAPGARVPVVPARPVDAAMIAVTNRAAKRPRLFRISTSA